MIRKYIIFFTNIIMLFRLDWQTGIVIFLILLAIVGVILLSIYISPWFATCMIPIFAAIYWVVFLRKDREMNAGVHLQHVPSAMRALQKIQAPTEIPDEVSNDNVLSSITETSVLSNDANISDIVNKLTSDLIVSFDKTLITSDEFNNLPNYVMRNSNTSENTNIIIKDIYINIIRHIQNTYGYKGTIYTLYTLLDDINLLNDYITFSDSFPQRQYDMYQVAEYKRILVKSANLFKDVKYVNDSSIASDIIPKIIDDFKAINKLSKPIYYILLKNVNDMFKFKCIEKRNESSQIGQFSQFDYKNTYLKKEYDNFSVLLNSIVYSI